MISKKPGDEVSCGVCVCVYASLKNGSSKRQTSNYTGNANASGSVHKTWHDKNIVTATHKQCHVVTSFFFFSLLVKVGPVYKYSKRQKAKFGWIRVRNIFLMVKASSHLKILHFYRAT